MGKFLFVAALLLAGAGIAAADSGRLELEGSIQFEVRVFPGSQSYPEQRKSHVSPSVAVAPELIYETESGNDRLTFIPFYRLDAHDPERTHWDIREANWLHLEDSWTLVVGAGKVFWGVTESVHLVDIINQTDLVEDLDGEDKLGQPMANFTVEHDFGAVSLFVLPGFRERTFPGSRARLRGALPIDNDNATYDSGAKEWHVDYAVRWSKVFGDLDIGLSHFHGTSREPRFNRVNDGTRTVLRPHYDQIDQTGLDLQYTTGPWLWKLEAMTRSGHGDRFVAGVGGVEYTIFQISGAADLGLLAEISQDERDTDRAPRTPSDNDVFAGARLTLNDDKDTSALAGFVVDRLTGETLMSLETERRLSDSLKFELEARLTLITPENGFTQGIRNDDYFTLRLTKFF